MGDPNPIITSNTYNTALESLKDTTVVRTSYLEANTQINNINSEILLKKDQLIKIKNSELNEQIKYLQDYESSIINKDRLIEETNNYIEKNNRNIIVLIFCIVFAIFLCIIVSSYVYNRISPKIFTLLLLFVILMYIFLFLYSYDIFYFKTAVNFLDYRKNRNLANAVKDLSTITKTDLQKKLYGSKKDWDEKNCECEEMPAIYPTETNVSVKNIPGYYYYDGNAPKQLIVGNNGGETLFGGKDMSIESNTPVNVSSNPNTIINNKIDWVDFDKNRDTDEEGTYELNISNNNTDTLVASSTYTANL